MTIFAVLHSKLLYLQTAKRIISCEVKIVKQSSVNLDTWLNKLILSVHEQSTYQGR